MSWGGVYDLGDETTVTGTKKMGFFDKIVGSLPIVGDIVSGIFSGKEASKQRKWQERMANTSHQREVADLRAAGLNPILSGTGGAGAATPSGAQAAVPDYGRGLSSALQLKMQKQMTDAQVNNLNASAELSRAGAAKAIAETPDRGVPQQAAQIGLAKSNKEIQEIEARIDNIRTMTTNTAQATERAKREMQALADDKVLISMLAPTRGQEIAVKETMDKLIKDGDIQGFLAYIIANLVKAR